MAGRRVRRGLLVMPGCFPAPDLAKDRVELADPVTIALIAELMHTGACPPLASDRPPSNPEAQAS